MLKGGSVRVYQFVLSFNSEFKSWTLHSKAKLPKLPDVRVATLPRLYTAKIPARSDERDNIGVLDARKCCITAHKFLFAFLCGLPFEHNEMAKFSSVFADCLVLAQFYLIMPKLGVLFERLIHGQWQFGADVIKESGFYLGIAEIFQSQRILEEAMRHHIGRGELWKNSSKLSMQMEILAWQKNNELFQLLAQLNQDLANVEPELRHPLFEDESPEQPPR